MSNSTLPRLAMVLGDPAGIGPELIARLLSEPEVRGKAHVLLIADEAEMRRGMDIAGRSFPYRIIESTEALQFTDDTPLLLPFRGHAEGEFVRSQASVIGGRYSLDTLEQALRLTAAGSTDAILFGPLNKTSLHMAGMGHSDELHWFAEYLGFEGPFCEFNVLDNLWTSRVTSHVALADVPGMLSQQRVLEAIGLIDTALKRNGLDKPRIGVCGLNPHNGDNGSFGREELDIIGPAVELAREQGIDAVGPYPGDTIFLKVQGDSQAFDAVVTMYHDQGQIAIKLMGFSRGVTVQGGLPIPITTPAHGTAFDIAGQGKANVGATRQAFEIACRMGARRQA
ncbi:4-hydroxythreonine-4-phosphate dehydrogenase PdxA [Pseudomonas sp. 21LCFQ02]|uniref:4-hydroxythreonine-4-phosphate dehydrogenase PdxA n=1 Tax=Pseudomonas sp. 21LCFQ02 TaxID=2957505 RepID=UPI00209B5171|nr:4-hydroxythreonine-4-phosphate dehydrogenase PdxA [Pseudomonas sp. 21LCFQ02]MCO8167203.1 4-hydroxythreonine-4-phosphate dehydrogenase PdxA [Pseudomonas sp. 21LCFQ02]